MQFAQRRTHLLAITLATALLAPHALASSLWYPDTYDDALPSGTFPSQGPGNLTLLGLTEIKRTYPEFGNFPKIYHFDIFGNDIGPSDPNNNLPQDQILGPILRPARPDPILEPFGATLPKRTPSSLSQNAAPIYAQMPVIAYVGASSDMQGMILGAQRWDERTPGTSHAALYATRALGEPDLGSTLVAPYFRDESPADAIGGTYYTTTFMYVHDYRSGDTTVEYRSLDGIDQTPESNILPFEREYRTRWRPAQSDAEIANTETDPHAELQPGGPYPHMLSGTVGSAAIRFQDGQVAWARITRRDAATGAVLAAATYEIPGEADPFLSIGTPHIADSAPTGADWQPISGEIGLLAITNTNDAITPVSLSAWAPDGTALALDPPTFDIPANATILWRPFAADPSVEHGAELLPRLPATVAAAALRLDTTTGGIHAVQFSIRPNGLAAMRLEPMGDATSAALPVFDDDALPGPLQTEYTHATLVHLHNASDEPVHCSIRYTDITGTEQVPAWGQFSLRPRETTTFRPVRHDTPREGSGVRVPDMPGGQNKGMLRIDASAPVLSGNVEILSAADHAMAGLGRLLESPFPQPIPPDTDDDGIPDAFEAPGNADNDEIPNTEDTDSDNDGIPDAEEGTDDLDHDGLGNYIDTDSDGDGVSDADEVSAGTDPYVATQIDFNEGDPDTATETTTVIAEMPCEESAEFSQTTILRGFTPSALPLEMAAFEHFEDLTEPISAISWRGYAAKYLPGGYAICGGFDTTKARKFRVQIFAETTNGPGQILVQRTAHLKPFAMQQIEDTTAFTLMEYRLSFWPLVEITRGYLSVQSLWEDDCEFAWAHAAGGDGVHLLQEANELRQIATDLSLCIKPQTPPIGGDECPVPCATVCELIPRVLDVGAAVDQLIYFTSDIVNPWYAYLRIPAAFIDTAVSQPTLSPFCCIATAWAVNYELASTVLAEAASPPQDVEAYAKVIATAFMMNTNTDFLVILLGQVGATAEFDAIDVSAADYISSDGDFDMDGVCNSAEINAALAEFGLTATIVQALSYAVDPEIQNNGGGCSAPCFEEGGAIAAPDDSHPQHVTDTNNDNVITLTELLRAIQFYNVGQLHCETGTEDNYGPGPGSHDCLPYSADNAPYNWQLSLSELLRLIQFYNSLAFHPCNNSEDGYCPGPA